MLRRISRVLEFSLLLKVGSTLRSVQISQGFIQLWFENLQGWKLHSFPGQPYLLWDCPQLFFTFFPIHLSCSFSLGSVYYPILPPDAPLKSDVFSLTQLLTDIPRAISSQTEHCFHIFPSWHLCFNPSHFCGILVRSNKVLKHLFLAQCFQSRNLFRGCSHCKLFWNRKLHSCTHRWYCCE